MKNKQQHDSDGEQKFNLGQRDASLEKDKDAQLSHMGERSKATGRPSKEAPPDRKR